MFLRVVHTVIHNGGNNGDIHRSLKCCIRNYRTTLRNKKKIKSTYSVNQI